MVTTDTKLAKQDLEEKGYTCVLRKGEETCFSYEHGVKPLLQWIREGKDFSGYGAADQVRTFLHAVSMADHLKTFKKAVRLPVDRYLNHKSCLCRFLRSFPCIGNKT